MRDAWLVLRHHKWLLLGLALAGAIVGLLIGLIQTPIYRASTSIAIQDADQLRVLRDDGFIDKVLQRTGADRQPYAVAGAGIIDRIRRALGQQPPPPTRDALIAAAQQNLAVQLSPSGRVADITMDAADPRVAAAIANELSGELIDEDIDTRVEASRRQIDSAKAPYDRSAAQLQDYLDLGGARWGEQYSALKREATSDRAAYEAVRQKTKESAPSSIRVIAPARPQLRPIRPSPFWNAVVGLPAGLFLGLLIVLIREKANRNFRVPGDIKEFLDLPELGAIPSAELESVQSIASRKDFTIDVQPENWPRSDSRLNGADRLETVSCSNQTSPIAESFRSALASLWLTGRHGKQPRVFVFTSPNAREGKTTLTSNLGIALANSNRRVLLIDGDLRKPRLHTVFNLSNTWGLGNLLEEDCPVEEYMFEDLVAPTAIPGLFVLPAGTGEVNISSLRFHERLVELMLRFRLEFHAVLIDTPPMLQFSDARILGRLSDGVIMVVRASATSRDDAMAVYGRFREDGTPVLGSILNDWNPKRSKYTYGYRTSGVYR